MLRRSYLLTLVVLLLGLAGCSDGGDNSQYGRVIESESGFGSYRDISPAELEAMLTSKDFLFINVHVPYEGEIEQTDLFIPYDQAPQRLGELPADKGAKIVVYCQSDRMSRLAVKDWLQAGYTNLYNLDGGFVAWQEAGFNLLQKEN